MKFPDLSFSGNIYRALVLRLLLVMALFTVCRVGFYLFNMRYFPDMAISDFARLLWGGLKFDLVAVVYTNLLVIIMMVLPFDFRFHLGYQKAVKYIFIIFNSIALAANVSDFIYYRFTLRRTTADVVKQFEHEQNFGSLIFRFLIDYWYAVLFWIVLVVVMLKVYNAIRVWGPQTSNRLKYYLGGIAVVPVVAFVVIVSVRGGIAKTTRPITLSNAGEYVRDPKHISIVLNTPFALMRTIGKTKINKVDYYPEKELETIFTPVHRPVDTAAFRNLNVVVIILESFSKEFFGTFNRDKDNGTYGFTPFLDSLIDHGLTYEYSLSNGRKSIDGLPSIFSGIPSLGVPYFLSPYSGNRINSLASLLEEKGYHSSFFHGAPNGSMGFQAFMNIAGVDNYYGMDEYENEEHYDGLWGIWDDKFLQYYADRLNEFPQPFVSSLFSVSSHHPFRVPEEYEGRYKEGPLEIHKCIAYTDDALRKFFRKASAMPWYDNTLFVITADHTSALIHYPEYMTSYGLYSIPIIFFRPDHSVTGRRQEIFQQTDIMASVLGYLRFDKEYVAFGRDAFRENTEPYAFNYKDNVYQLFMGDYLLVYDGRRSVGLYDFKKDKMLEKNVLREKPEVVAAMEPQVKAIIQQYNNRLIEDRLTAESP